MSPARTTDRMAGRLRSLAGAAVRRLRLLGWSYALAVLGLAGLGLLALILAAVPLLVLFPVGASLLLALVRLVRRFADAHRWIIGSTLRDGDHEYGAAAFDPGGLRLLRRADDAAAMFPRGYQSWPSGSRWHQLRQVAGEPATWRDLAWLLVGGPAALVAVRIQQLMAAGSPAAKAGSAAASRRARLETLTPREREVLALIAEGRTNAAIAAHHFGGRVQLSLTSKRTITISSVDRSCG